MVRGYVYMQHGYMCNANHENSLVFAEPLRLFYRLLVER